jgi:hypothetical protein
MIKLKHGLFRVRRRVLLRTISAALLLGIVVILPMHFISTADAVSTPVDPRKFAIINYAPPPPGGVAWLDQRFTMRISGAKPEKEGVNYFWYKDFHGTSSGGEYSKLKEFAVSHGWILENIFLHARVNYQSKPHLPVIWRKMDMFDTFEGKNGVLTSTNDTDFIDVTLKAYDGSVSLSKMLTIGYDEPFAVIRFDVKEPGKGCVLTWSYWNGDAWSPLSVVDTTHQLAKNGTVAFTPPYDWEPRSLNRSHRKFFVRLTLSEVETFPVTQSIKGEDWLNGAPNAGKGWDSTNPGIMRGRHFSFNPTPPPGASARFPYQARLTFWAANNFVANHADIQTYSGKPFNTWASFLSAHTIPNLTAGGYAGLMLDDVRKYIWDDFLLKVSDVDFPRPHGTSEKELGTLWNRAREESIRAIRSYLKAADPKLLIGVNSQQREMLREADWNLSEYHTQVWQTGSHESVGIAVNEPAVAYDDYLTPSGSDKFGILIYADTGDIKQAGRDIKHPVFWDRGNRGPMTALSKHYIAANDRSWFAYQANGGYIYNATDEIYYYLPNSPRVTVPVSAELKSGTTVIKSEPDGFKEFTSSGTIRVGNNICQFEKLNKSEIRLKGALGWSVPIGEKIRLVKVGHQSQGEAHPVEDVYRWGAWFPAMGVDVGVSDVGGYNGGRRDLMWKTGKSLHTRDEEQVGPNVWRRDFTKAIVLHRPAFWDTTKSQYDTPSPPIDIGREVYPLRADGTTGPATHTVTLRAGEGAVLMKYLIDQPEQRSNQN